jgi:prepilin-type N-terminal cleavage/methylation domain-containing protein
MSSKARHPDRAFLARTGMSILEVLVVLIVFSIGSMIAVPYITATNNRHLNSAAGNDLRIIAQRAYVEMQKGNVVTFLRVAPPAADGTTPIQVWVDADSSNTLDTTKDTLVTTYSLPAIIGLTSPAPTGITGATTWDQWVAVAANDHHLGCDLQGRAFNPTTGAQLVRPAILLTMHQYMTAGTLTPKVAYIVNISPVWNARLTQGIPGHDITLGGP